MSSKKPSRFSKKTPAQLEHDKWLRKRGVHPDQLALKKKRGPDFPNYDCSKENLSECGHQVSADPKKRGLSNDEIETVANNYTVAQPYSKGPYMVIPNKADIQTIGKK